MSDIFVFGKNKSLPLTAQLRIMMVPNCFNSRTLSDTENANTFFAKRMTLTDDFPRNGLFRGLMYLSNVSS